MRASRFGGRPFGNYLASLGVWAVMVAIYSGTRHVCGAVAPFQFVDVSAARGIDIQVLSGGWGAGGAAADFDDDGDIDVFIPGGAGQRDRLYENIGNANFRDIAVAAGVTTLDNNRCALWIDYDGDGDLDLLVANDDANNATTFRLYRQFAVAEFEDVTVAAGLFMPFPPRTYTNQLENRAGLCAGDINNDGYLDFFAPIWNGPDWLFVNNGNSTFTRVPNWSDPSQQGTWAHQPVMLDFDGDGWVDIYEAQDFEPNRLWINQHDNTFIDMGLVSGSDNNMNDMGVSVGDFDRNGTPDIYVTNIQGNGWNVLLKNLTSGGVLQFSEVGVANRVSGGGWGWGATFFDADNDGWLDIAATNGLNEGADDSKMFWNQGNGTPFLDVSAEVQFNDLFWGSDLISFDCDRDGDLDLLQVCKGAPTRLLENRPSVGATVNNYLVVKPRMAGPNRFAIGAVVRLRAGGQTSTRWIMAGTSYMGQEPAEAFFGVGSEALATTVRVDWPDGTRTVLHDVPVNQVLVVNGPGVDPTVPTVSEWGLIAMVFLLLAAGGGMVTRRRTVATPNA